MEIPNLLGCVVFDKVSNQHLGFTFCNSKEEYIRNNVESFIRSSKNLNDLTPKIICEYNVITGEIIPKNEVFGFDCYKMPATKADALAPLGVDFAKDALEFQQWKEEREKKLREKEGN